MRKVVREIPEEWPIFTERLKQERVEKRAADIEKAAAIAVQAAHQAARISDCDWAIRQLEDTIDTLRLEVTLLRGTLAHEGIVVPYDDHSPRF